MDVQEGRPWGAEAEDWRQAKSLALLPHPKETTAHETLRTQAWAVDKAI